MADLLPGLIDAVKGFEGWSPRASWDYKQHTNGWGTRASYPGEVIDQTEGGRRLETELGKASGLVGAFAPNLDPGTHSALTSLTYNAGNGWMNSGLGKAVQSGDMDAVRSHLLQYNKAGGKTLPGLVSRRGSEAGWIGKPDALGGPPGPTQGPTPPDAGQGGFAAAAQGASKPDTAQGAGAFTSYSGIEDPDPARTASLSGTASGALNGQPPSLLDINKPQPQMSALGAKGVQPPMADPNDDPRLRNGGGMSPLVMMGLGLLTSGMEGKGFSQGLLGGANAAQGFDQNRIQELNSERNWAVKKQELPLHLQQLQQALQLGQLNLDQSKRQFQPNVGLDAYGRVPGFIDPVNMRVYDTSGKPINTGADGAVGGGVAGRGDPSLTGDAFLATLPKPLAAELAAINEGRKSVSPQFFRGQTGETRLRQLMQAYPDFNEQNYHLAMAARKNYEAGGKQFQELQAIGTVAGHLSDFKDAADKLDNFSSEKWGVATQPLNAINDMIKEKKEDRTRARFNTLKTMVMDELTKAYRGGSISDAAVHDFAKNIDGANSPEKLKEVIGTLNSSLMSKRLTMEEGYNNLFGRMPGAAPQFSTVNARTKGLFEDIDKWAYDKAAPKGAASAPTAPQPTGGPGVARIQAMPLDEIGKLDPKSLSIDELRAVVERRRGGR